MVHMQLMALGGAVDGHITVVVAAVVAVAVAVAAH